VAKRGFQAVKMEGDDGGGHHRKAGMFGRHLVDGTVGSLNREFHQIFDVIAVLHPVAKGFLEHIDGCLRSDLARLGAADSIGNSKDSAFMIGQERVFVQRALLVEAAIADRSNLYFG
jgi:hypothetical protein